MKRKADRDNGMDEVKDDERRTIVDIVIFMERMNELMGRNGSGTEKGDEKEEEEENKRGSNTGEENHDGNGREVHERGVSRQRFYAREERRTEQL